MSGEPRWSATLGIAFAMAGTPALACYMADTEFTYEHVFYADVVVIASIASYEAVLDEKLSGRIEERSLRGYGNMSMDYARLTLNVQEVLYGEAQPRLVVASRSYDFPVWAEQGRKAEYLIAYTQPIANRTDATFGSFWSTPDWDLPSVVSLPCQESFFFSADSLEAETIRSIFLSDDPEATANAYTEAQAAS